MKPTPLFEDGRQYIVTEIAKVLGVSDPRRITAFIRAGEIPAFDWANPGCRPKWKVNGTDMNAWIEKREKDYIEFIPED